MSVQFLIKHRPSGKVFHPKCGQARPGNGEHIVLHSDIHKNTYWTFEPVTEHWGYIKHVASGLVIHPATGQSPPKNGTDLLLHGDRHWGALFALDEVNGHVVHKRGLFAHPKTGRVFPSNGELVNLHEAIHDGMKFDFVSITDPNKKVPVYGKPTLLGKWKVINMVLNPKAEHTQTLEVKIGKSMTTSTTSSFKYGWEVSMGVSIKEVFDFSSSQSVELMFETTSSSTWSEEKTVTREIKVSPGQTVVTWQYVFSVEQNETKSIFNSNILADTDSESQEPRDLQKGAPMGRTVLLRC